MRLLEQISLKRASMKVLIVTDDAAKVTEIARSIEDSGYEVAVAQTLTGAVRQIELDRRIRLVIVDFKAEETDGSRIFEMLKQHGLSDRVEVIICSEAKDPKSVVRTIEMGAADYLVKPYDLESLLTRVGRLVEKIGRTVLIVDDEELMRGLLVRIVERDGYFSLTASGGTEALSMLEANKADVVIIDVMMPEMNGLDLLAKIKERWPDLPVLLVTCYKDRFAQSDKAELADGFLSKPFKNIEVIKLLEQCTRNRQRRHQPTPARSEQ
ncbi:MAG: response regulator [Candidatus Zixiibacteriota bacterium]|nr:MAG: response regulator [candidate division Zixibacteria bacterium]